MKKITVASDSFKGSLGQLEICDIARETVRAVFGSSVTVDCVPIADGGEGSAECFRVACGGETVTVPEVCGPDGEKMSASYAILKDGRAVVETAACAGLALLGERRLPLTATTYGLGQLILDAAQRGCREILLCLGGSATTDCGCGMAAAVGYRFYDEEGKSFVPAGGTLSRIARIGGGPAPVLRDVRFRVLCDVDAVLFGEKGAAFVYGPQKGASPEQVRLLDAGLRHAGALIDALRGQKISAIRGSGAAGGLGAASVAFLGGELCPGIETMLDTAGFDGRIADTDLIITGEGRLDSQSLTGKAAAGVAARAKKAGVTCAALVGCMAGDVTARQLDAAGFRAVFPTCRRAGKSFPEIAAHAAEDYRDTLTGLLRLLRTAERV